MGCLLREAASPGDAHVKDGLHPKGGAVAVPVLAIERWQRFSGRQAERLDG